MKKTMFMVAVLMALVAVSVWAAGWQTPVIGTYSNGSGSLTYTNTTGPAVSVGSVFLSGNIATGVVSSIYIVNSGTTNLLAQSKVDQPVTNTLGWVGGPGTVCLQRNDKIVFQSEVSNTIRYCIFLWNE